MGISFLSILEVQLGQIRQIGGKFHPSSQKRFKIKYTYIYVFILPIVAVVTIGVFTNNSGEKTNPSFVIMDIQGNVLVLYVYTLVDEEIKVDKLQYRADK